MRGGEGGGWGDGAGAGERDSPSRGGDAGEAGGARPEPSGRSGGRVELPGPSEGTGFEMPGVPGSDRRVLRELARVVGDEAGSAVVEMARAHRLLRRAGAALDGPASVEGWPVPFSTIRCLVLAQAGTASPYGIRPSLLARNLVASPSTLAHHLDVLEEAGLIDRRRPGVHDGRKVRVTLTDRGAYALWRLGSALGALRRRGGSARGASRPPAP